MKKITMFGISAILAGSLVGATPAWAATDYSAMTNEELAAKRGAMQQATTEERNAFQNEWQKRVQQMSPEEKQKAMSRPANAAQDGTGRKNGQGQGGGRKNAEGQGGGQRLRDGSEAGSMGGNGGGMGRGMGGGRR